MILVTGATGNVGRAVVQQLAGVGEPVRAMVRDLRRAADLPDRAEPFVADLGDADALLAAMRGIDRVFLMDTSHGIDNTARAVHAAVQSGVEHIVNLSSIGASLDPIPQIGRWHREREEFIESSGVGVSFIRPGYFMSNTLAWADAVNGDHVVRQPGGSSLFAPVDPADIAAVAATWLMRPSEAPGARIAVLTGPELTDLPGQVHTLAQVLRRELAYEDVTDEQVAVDMRARGIPESFVDAAVELNGTLRSGRLGFVSSDVQTITGRRPRSYREWAEAHADRFAAPGGRTPSAT
jgi:uncharacterized protein YbjT (DUF2867 family)